ncbi:hypothetical protein H8S95_09210 [Pontibacter sp. KCTC 32443]|uniref:hypothetical protein n=1 Tax=Pontibacter TaxID=323449 RepID=UPI00164DA247|nr:MULTISPECIES: hypothetical protein [Pontibacter]MBC5774239.1 hypothetical protein [Pontibacter sp. KCTC 32443]
MEKYEYTYQDWLDGNVQGEYLNDLRNDFSPNDFMKIERRIREAFIKRVNDIIKAFRRMFFIHFNMSLVKDEILSDWIDKIESKINKFRDKQPETVFMARLGGDGKNKFLTAIQVEEYFSFDAEKGNFDDVYDLYKTMEEGTKPLNYVIYVNFLKWLNWFKAEQLKNTSEPFLLLNTNIDEENQLRELLKDKNTSYKWQNNPNEELPKLHQNLLANGLINTNTTLDQFKAVFEAKPLNKIKPVDWVGDKNLLAYFVDYIYSNRLIHFNINQWSVAEFCFTNARNLAQSKDRYLSNKNIKHPGKPKNYQILDEVLKGLN